MRFNAALFDMDDTLISTRGLGFATMQSALGAQGIILSDEEVPGFDRAWRSGNVNNTEGWLKAAAERRGRGHEYKELLKNFYSRYVAAVADAPQLPGVDDFLKRVFPLLPLALVTASMRAQVDRVLRHHGWEGMFQVRVAQEDYHQPKPNPEPYLIAAEKLKVKAGDCVVFEDSTSGITAAKRAGMYVIAVIAGSAQGIDTSFADVICRSFKEVQSYIFTNA